jgi:hypothetical protein
MEWSSSNGKENSPWTAGDDYDYRAHAGQDRHRTGQDRTKQDWLLGAGVVCAALRFCA